MRATRFAAMLGVAAILALSACASDGDGTAGGSDTPSAADSTMTTPSPSADMMAGKPFGAGCAAVPTDAANPGSFDAMSKVPVATAASGNPALKTLVAAVTKAKLGDSLNAAKDITVFAPADSAFAKIPAATLDAVLANDTQLKSILTYHVVPQRLSPEKLAGTYKTLQGTDLTVVGSGEQFTVNGNAMVVCGNVQTANATVYIVDTVLMPKA